MRGIQTAARVHLDEVLDWNRVPCGDLALTEGSAAGPQIAWGIGSETAIERQADTLTAFREFRITCDDPPLTALISGRSDGS